ncbi:hypothetical protein EDD15DRAFT_2459429 [Pisolithus albus]|nr:hypothetical protein EDD15DRAFT_2459429 [Pisolithus albus]
MAMVRDSTDNSGDWCGRIGARYREGGANVKLLVVPNSCDKSSVPTALARDCLSPSISPSVSLAKASPSTTVLIEIEESDICPKGAPGQEGGEGSSDGMNFDMGFLRLIERRPWSSWDMLVDTRGLSEYTKKTETGLETKSPREEIIHWVLDSDRWRSYNSCILNRKLQVVSFGGWAASSSCTEMVHAAKTEPQKEKVSVVRRFPRELWCWRNLAKQGNVNFGGFKG